MMTAEDLMAIAKNGLQEAAKALSRDDITQLVDWLSMKDDNIRYQAFLLLQNRSLLAEDVYPFWHVFQGKLQSDNSYQRSIGLMLLAENARWDTENKMENALDAYLALLDDEKPITVRQCIQSLEKIATYQPGLSNKIADRLIGFDLMAVKETMRKSILCDILNALLAIRKNMNVVGVEPFILEALSGGILGKKEKKQIEGLL